MVVLVLPDGSKRIPAAWAHEGGGEDTGAPAAAVVAAAGDLLRLLRVISGIPATAGIRPEQAARQSPARRTTVQPAQLSLLPDQVPAPPSQLASQLPPPIVASRGRDRDTPDHPGGATRIAGRVRNASPARRTRRSKG